VKVLATRVNPTRLVLLVVIMFLLVAAAWQATAPGAARPAVAMSAECHQAYRGYMEASDAAEADFWAESWMTFGCETGGGYWA
jgi:hypothetical protein